LFAAAVILTLFVALPGTRAAEWPQWRGAEHNGQSPADSGWDQGVWQQAGGPEELWQAQLGAGCSSVVMAGQRVYGVGWSSGRDRVSCIDLKTGEVLWQQEYETPQYGRHATGDQGFYLGPSASPTYDQKTGWLFTLGCDGELRAWDTGDAGRKLWRLNLYDEFDVPQRPQVTERHGTLRDYGYTTSPLVWNDWLLVEVGCPERGNLVALDKSTGEPVWWSELKDPAGHTGGLVPMQVDGSPCVVVLTLTGIAVVRLDGAEPGATLGRLEWRTHFGNNIATPAVHGQDLLVTTKWNNRTSRLRISLQDGIEEVWTSERSSNVCSAIVHNGHVYWAHRGLYCQDWENGELLWSGGRFSDASSIVMTADDRLILWSNDGDLALVEGAGRSQGSYRELAWIGGLGDEMAWPHLVVVGGRILAKDRAGRLICLKIDGESDG
jgi:outer membrane protein assembly factor BamB